MGRTSTVLDPVSSTIICPRWSMVHGTHP
eukprot:gene26542-biopygen16807